MKSATRITVSAFGALVGVAGIEHGIGEILQGNTAPGSLMILSWPGEGPFRVLGGEPALTIIPNLLVSGVFSVLVSLLFVALALRFIETKHGPMMLAVLSLVMFLVGGGIFPPVFGIILAAVSTRIDGGKDQRPSALPRTLRNFVGQLWPWSLGIGLSTWLFMMPGLPLLSHVLGLGQNAELISLLALGMIGFLISTILTGFAFDSLRNTKADFSGSTVRTFASTAGFQSKE